MSSPAGLLTKARSLIAALAETIGESSSGSAIHGARRQIKMIRSLLRLLRPALGEERYQLAADLLREASHSLAGRRRADALLALADKLGLKSLHKVAEHHHTAHEASGGVQVESARQAIRRLHENAAGWNLPDHDRGQIETQFLHAYAQGREGLARAFKLGGTERLHEARKKVIVHRYQLQLLPPDLCGDAAQRIARLERLRDRLGELNDLDELHQLAKHHDHDPGKKTRRKLKRRRHRLLAKARKAAHALYRLKPKAFARRIGVMS